MVFNVHFFYQHFSRLIGLNIWSIKSLTMVIRNFPKINNLVKNVVYLIKKKL